MRKSNIVIISLIVIILAGITAFMMFKSSNKSDNISEGKLLEIADEEILDECTDEYELMQNEIIKTNSENEKISPNASLILNIYYKKCGHTTSEYKDIPQELVNKTKQELQETYKEWNVDKFSDTEIILSKEEEGECGEHFIVRTKNEKVVIYKILDDETEEEYEITDISSEYLSETDKVNMQNGIRVNGKQNLNQLIEDFE